MSDFNTQPKRRLRVGLDELDYAFGNSTSDLSFYLDVETGQVLEIMDEFRHKLDEIYEEYVDETDEEVDLPQLLASIDLKDWEKEELLKTHQVEQGYAKQFIQVPSADSHEGFRDMEDFINTVKDRRLQGYLNQAVHGKSPFRRFKDALQSVPAERERWFSFQNARLRQRVLDWLESEGIEPIDEP